MCLDPHCLRYLTVSISQCLRHLNVSRSCYCVWYCALTFMDVWIKMSTLKFFNMYLLIAR
ncbi:hypothetical protein GDO81_023375 [Engystomops pustulosus]|uniref:Uncharacterized protein n=1 Tax=Engystomops pustulosus TaxID=76066 RepID=A0AAV6YS57_ENGPU|nr:hypothetical protein GDO81_023375 [Engystomops pustulosus]